MVKGARQVGQEGGTSVLILASTWGAVMVMASESG